MKSKQEQVKQAIDSVGGIVRNQGNPKLIRFGTPTDTTTDVLNDSFHTPLPDGATLRKVGNRQFEVTIR